MTDLSVPLRLVEQAIACAAPGDCPALLGQLERLRALAWGRMREGNHVQTPPAPGEESLLTIPEVAQRLKISAYRAYELARQGRLPHQKIGKLVRVSLRQLAEFQSRHKSGR